MEKMRGKERRSKRGQLTIFVILAIAIIAILVIVFYPNIKKAFIPPTISELIPKDCVEKAVKDSLVPIMTHGGALNPQLYFNYNNISIGYLCYTSEWYKTCIMQKPFLKEDIERETLKNSSTKIKNCYDTMIENFKRNGYDVKLNGDEKIILSLEPKKVVVYSDMDLTLTKNDVKTTLNSNQLKININSNAYDLIMIASSILNFEARYGDSTPEDYMAFYPNLKVQKLKQSDGTKVYIINDRNTLETLNFATRSLAWPPGFVAPLFPTNNGVVA